MKEVFFSKEALIFIGIFIGIKILSWLTKRIARGFIKVK